MIVCVLHGTIVLYEVRSRTGAGGRRRDYTGLLSCNDVIVAFVHARVCSLYADIVGEIGAFCMFNTTFYVETLLVWIIKGIK